MPECQAVALNHSETPAPAFANEKEMRPVVEGWLTQQDFQTKIEFSTPWGVCDLVGCRFQREHLKKRQELGQRWPLGPLARVAIFYRIANASAKAAVTLDEVHRDLDEHFGHQKVADHISALRRRRFLLLDDRDRLQPSYSWLPLQETLVAVELKLTRVSEAIYQAKLNREFADESYVALPEEVAYKAQEDDSSYGFSELGIGLLAVSEHSLTLLLPAQRSSAKITTLQIHSVERFYRSWPRGSSA